LDKSYANPVIQDVPGRGEVWETTDLVWRLCHALDIAKETIGLLASDGFSNPDDPGNKIVPEKIIGETAFLLFASSVVNTHKEIAERIKVLAAILILYARNEKILLEICLHPAIAMEYAQAHVCLKSIGYPDDRFDEVLIKSIGAQAHHGRERNPHRMLEQEWIKKIGGYRPAPAHINITIADSVLTQPIDLLHGTRDDVYAFTHALMYVSSFNVDPWPIQRSREEILSEADAMLARCLDEQDYDLAGEVLLSWPLTGKTWSAPAVFAFRVLTKVEDEAGFLPSPATRVDTLQQLEGDNRKKYLFATAYHTAYVMGLLCSAALQPGRTPPKNIPVDNLLSTGSAKRILPFLRHDLQNTHWFNEFSQLTGPEQDALAGLLLNIALVQNIRQRKYGVVYQLVEIAYDLDIADTAMVIQAAELLDRLAALSGYVKQ